jgi:GTP-binding protein HflX
LLAHTVDACELTLILLGEFFQVVGSTYQVLPTPNPATFIGMGKLNEVVTAVRATGAETVIFDDELSPAQLRNLERALTSSTSGSEENPVRVRLFADAFRALL